MSNIDKRNRLDEDLFSYRVSKDGKVFITWQGKQIVVLKDEKARRLLLQLEGADRRQVQLVLAKTTGNFKHGNERLSRGGE
jgi:hypothetical protein